MRTLTISLDLSIPLEHSSVSHWSGLMEQKQCLIPSHDYQSFLSSLGLLSHSIGSRYRKGTLKCERLVPYTVLKMHDSGVFLPDPVELGSST